MNEEDYVLTETHNTILKIFQNVKNRLDTYPKYEDFKNEFDKEFKLTFDRIEDKRLVEIKRDYYDQGFIVDYIVNTVPVKITDDIHGIGVGIMQGVLQRLSSRIGIIINVVEDHAPEFKPVIIQ